MVQKSAVYSCNNRFLRNQSLKVWDHFEEHCKKRLEILTYKIWMTKCGWNCLNYAYCVYLLVFCNPMFIINDY